jgi:uncharacterized damage-inducible protein DinB
MRRAKRLANRIERTITGPMWHGPALLDLPNGVTCTQALGRPLPAAHSIWALVRHVTAWCEIVRRRIKGEAIDDPSPEQDWPPVPDAAPDGPARSASELSVAWERAVERLAASHRQLAADTRLLGDAELDALVDGQDYTVGVMLDGIVEHGTYHGGQIALLRKS